MTATAELVVPKSIPMTEPLTFSSPPSAYPRVNMAGALKAGVRRAAEAARGKKVRDNLEDSIVDVRDAAGGDASDRRLGAEMDGGRAMVYMM